MSHDVVKVDGEDPDTPGYLRGDRVRLGRQRSWILGASPLTRSLCTPLLPSPKIVRLWGVHWHRTGWQLSGVPFESTLQTV